MLPKWFLFHVVASLEKLSTAFAKFLFLLQAVETMEGKDMSDNENSWNLNGLLSFTDLAGRASIRTGQ